MDLILLVNRAKKGDRIAETQIIRATQDRLFRFCIHMCNEPMLAEDVVQETYLRAFGHLDKLTDPAGTLSWFFTLARNIYIDIKRRKKNQPTKEADENAMSESVTAKAPGDILTFIAIKDALAQLSDDDRTLLLLVDHEEYSYAEAAKIIGISESNVKFRLHHARKAFVKAYRNE